MNSVMRNELLEKKYHPLSKPFDYDFGVQTQNQIKLTLDDIKPFIDQINSVLAEKYEKREESGIVKRSSDKEVFCTIFNIVVFIFLTGLTCGIFLLIGCLCGGEKEENPETVERKKEEEDRERKIKSIVMDFNKNVLHPNSLELEYGYKPEVIRHERTGNLMRPMYPILTLFLIRNDPKQESQLLQQEQQQQEIQPQQQSQQQENQFHKQEIV
jgi:hypothetical protein